MWQGPHHGAHASTSTGTGERSTSWAKLASVTGWGRPTGSAARHLPQTGARPAATLSAATRLVAPQAGQRIIKGSTAGAPSAVILPRPARRRQRHDALECAGHAVL